ncbi:Hypothetical Protein FCC1311_013492 [Hondaea fermentalgiana]|uniref:Uncharacterized protein n=1 Tax=Hondaea fermentalgiana TaxID=2315210 RepID=A0A2R5G2B6_9STRA|nr:Hypothetical Protein FCC1311_013492 [Hondaea fermentalgiana]|eukprot:GBG25132.1 Hypothetical Protein FCC1311_013492 [Hondaea fermentalgiana]
MDNGARACCCASLTGLFLSDDVQGDSTASYFDEARWAKEFAPYLGDHIRIALHPPSSDNESGHVHVRSGLLNVAGSSEDSDEDEENEDEDEDEETVLEREEEDENRLSHLELSAEDILDDTDKNSPKLELDLEGIAFQAIEEELLKDDETSSALSLEPRRSRRRIVSHQDANSMSTVVSEFEYEDLSPWAKIVYVLCSSRGKVPSRLERDRVEAKRRMRSWSPTRAFRRHATEGSSPRPHRLAHRSQSTIEHFRSGDLITVHKMLHMRYPFYSPSFERDYVGIIAMLMLSSTLYGVDYYYTSSFVLNDPSIRAPLQTDVTWFFAALVAIPVLGLGIRFWPDAEMMHALGLTVAASACTVSSIGLVASGCMGKIRPDFLARCAPWCLQNVTWVFVGSKVAQCGWPDPRFDPPLTVECPSATTSFQDACGPISLGVPLLPEMVCAADVEGFGESYSIAAGYRGGFSISLAVVTALNVILTWISARRGLIIYGSMAGLYSAVSVGLLATSSLQRAKHNQVSLALSFLCGLLVVMSIIPLYFHLRTGKPRRRPPLTIHLVNWWRIDDESSDSDSDLDDIRDDVLAHSDGDSQSERSLLSPDQHTLDLDTDGMSSHLASPTLRSPDSDGHDGLRHPEDEGLGKMSPVSLHSDLALESGLFDHHPRTRANANRYHSLPSSLRRWSHSAPSVQTAKPHRPRIRPRAFWEADYKAKIKQDALPASFLARNFLGRELRSLQDRRPAALLIGAAMIVVHFALMMPEAESTSAVMWVALTLELTLYPFFESFAVHSIIWRSNTFISGWSTLVGLVTSLLVWLPATLNKRKEDSDADNAESWVIFLGAYLSAKVAYVAAHAVTTFLLVFRIECRGCGYPTLVKRDETVTSIRRFLIIIPTLQFSSLLLLIIMCFYTYQYLELDSAFMQYLTLLLVAALDATTRVWLTALLTKGLVAVLTEADEIQAYLFAIRTVKIGFSLVQGFGLGRVPGFGAFVLACLANAVFEVGMLCVSALRRHHPRAPHMRVRIANAVGLPGWRMFPQKTRLETALMIRTQDVAEMLVIAFGPIISQLPLHFANGHVFGQEKQHWAEIFLRTLVILFVIEIPVDIFKSWLSTRVFGLDTFHVRPRDLDLYAVFYMSITAIMGYLAFIVGHELFVLWEVNGENDGD